MDKIEEIKKLKALLDQCAISEDEFQKLKSGLLSNNQQSTSGSSTRNSRNNSKRKKRKGVIIFISTLLVFTISLLAVDYLRKNDISKLKLNFLPNQKENINSNNIDSLKMFDNIIYDKGVVVGKLVRLEFVKTANKSGRVVNIPDDKMWIPLYYESEDFGNNYGINIPEILTEQNENERVGRDYYYLNIYDDSATGTWWEKESGFYFLEKKDFKSIKLSIRNRTAISGKNAIYVRGYNKDVKYILYFFEEDIN